MTEKQLHEFGNAFSVTSSPAWERDAIEHAKESAKRDYMDTLQPVLDILTDVEIVTPFGIAELPPTDVLGRWKNYGWYVAFRSDQYALLQSHFVCKRRHEPYILTQDYAMNIMRRFISSEMED